MFPCRYVSTAAQRIQHGRLSHSVSTYAWIALRIIGIWAYIFRSCAQPILTVCMPLARKMKTHANGCVVWQWDQLRIMKVGGNESATKYFQTHGGSAALASKDPKMKYTSNTATKYKEELTRRCAIDAKQYVLISVHEYHWCADLLHLDILRRSSLQTLRSPPTLAQAPPLEMRMTSSRHGTSLPSSDPPTHLLVPALPQEANLRRPSSTPRLMATVPHAPSPHSLARLLHPPLLFDPHPPQGNPLQQAQRRIFSEPKRPSWAQRRSLQQTEVSISKKRNAKPRKRLSVSRNWVTTLKRKPQKPRPQRR